MTSISTVLFGLDLPNLKYAACLLSYLVVILRGNSFPVFFLFQQKPLRYRRAISYDSKEYYMRLLSGNPGMYQHSVEHSTEGETTPHEPEHGEDTIARVKGTDTIFRNKK